MILHAIEVRPLPGYRLFLRFNNGAAGEVDLSAELEGEVFEALRDPELFATAEQHPVMRTVAWANGADLAPEFLLARISHTRIGPADLPLDTEQIWSRLGLHAQVWPERGGVGLPF